MFDSNRRWRVLAGGVAAGVAGVVGFAGATASADPAPVQPAVPAPVTVTQTVTVAPSAAAAPAPAATPAPGASPEIPTMVAQPAPATVAPAPAPALPPLVPASSGTLNDFFRDKGVTLEPQNPRDFRALSITLPMPTGWSQVPDPKSALRPLVAPMVARQSSDRGWTLRDRTSVCQKLSEGNSGQAPSVGLDGRTGPGTDGGDPGVGGPPGTQAVSNPIRATPATTAPRTAGTTRTRAGRVVGRARAMAPHRHRRGSRLSGRLELVPVGPALSGGVGLSWVWLSRVRSSNAAPSAC